MLRTRLGCGLVVLAVTACHDAPPSGPLSRPVFFDADRTTPDPAVRFSWTHEAAPPSVLAMPVDRRRGATNAAGVAALWHLEHHAARWGLDATALAGVEVALVHDTGRGAIIVKLKQRFGGLEVMRTQLAVVMDRQLQLIALSGGLHGAPTAVGTLTAAALSAPGAIERAFDDAGAARPALVPVPDRAGYHRFAAAGLASPARVKQVLFPVGADLVPAWVTEVGFREPSRRIEGYRHVFAAGDGRLLYRAGLTDDAAFQYRVWADATGDLRPQDGPQGDYTPHPTGTPDGFDPPFVAPALITVDGLNTRPGGGSDPWLAAGATSTTGNNVDAYADLDNVDGFSAGDVRPTITAPGAFDRIFDVAAEPDASTAQRMAAVTQQFYVTNWMHDYFYDSGFTEAAGNAQTSNLGRGGLEGDVLLAEGQDAAGTNNADMTTFADGESPRMQMFLFDAAPGGVRRDGTLDSHVIEHEWGHYLHHRLVDCASFECAVMSEGWGDLMSLFQSVRPTDDLNGTWGLGAYPLRAFSTNGAYFGIRRYPYSTDFTKSPLTYRFMRVGEALPVGPAQSDVGFASSNNWEFHNAGEIWCAMLWEGVVAMVRQSQPPISRMTFDQARRRFADYIVAGMIAAPAEPTFTEQRDAILAAASASDPADLRVLAEAFARRGFGSRAVSPNISSFDGSGIIESFEVTGTLHVEAITLEEDPGSCDGDGIIDVGETGRVVAVVRNIGAATLAGPSVGISSTTSGVAFPAGASTTLGALAPGATATATFALRLDEGVGLVPEIALVIGASDASAAVSSTTRSLTTPANLDITPVASNTDRFEELALPWTASASGWARIVDGSSHVASVTVRSGGDHTLQTPGLQVTPGQDLTLAFRHRFQFAVGPSGPQAGGVVELSTDGTTFADVATFANPGYTAIVTGAGNPLAGRLAFTGSSSTTTTYADVAVDLGPSFGGQTVFLRFRAAAGDQASDSLWDVDDVTIGGLTNLPFPLVEVEPGSCLPGARPIADAGVDLTVASGATGALDGTASADPDGGALAFEWNQVSGQTLTLSSLGVAQPAFTAPIHEDDRLIRYQLVVRDPDGRVSLPSEVRITVLGTAGGDAGVDGAPDASIDAPPQPAPDAAAGPDAGDNPLEGGGAGCCETGSDPRGGLVLGLGLLVVLRRRR